jgi:sugar phosphate isomerase/epimerase
VSRFHPRLTVNGFPFRETEYADDVAYFASAGFPAVGLNAAKVEAHGWDGARELLNERGVRVAYLVKVSPFAADRPEEWPRQREELIACLSGARSLGASSVYTTAGPAGRLLFEEAVENLARAVEPVLPVADRLGIHLLVENSNPLGQSYSFVSSFRDLEILSAVTGFGICLDLFHVWREATLIDTFRRALPRIHLLQIGDYEPHIKTLTERVVPGDGIIPLERLLRGFLEAGYEGPVDLEITGPRILEETREAAFLRGALYLSDLLERLSPRPAGT